MVAEDGFLKQQGGWICSDHLTSLALQINQYYAILGRVADASSVWQVYTFAQASKFFATILALSLIVSRCS
jgi:hypothetical protein